MNLVTQVLLRVFTRLCGWLTLPHDEHTNLNTTSLRRRLSRARFEPIGGEWSGTNFVTNSPLLRVLYSTSLLVTKLLVLRGKVRKVTTWGCTCRASTLSGRCFGRCTNIACNQLAASFLVPVEMILLILNHPEYRDSRARFFCLHDWDARGKGCGDRGANVCAIFSGHRSGYNFAVSLYDLVCAWLWTAHLCWYWRIMTHALWDEACVLG